MSDPRVVAIIQARMSSKRLPGKVLAMIGDTPMLAWVVERSRLAKSVDEVVVATTVEDADDEIAEFCRQRSYAVWRGDPTDVLDRYRQVAQEYSADIIVRITADCPLIDAGLIDEAVEALITSDPPVDFVANRFPWGRTFPIGLDVEACTREALETAWVQADQKNEREHVMPYIYENPALFKVIQLDAQRDYGGLRWTVDTQRDLEFVREVVGRLPDQLGFGWKDVLTVVQEHPELQALNADVAHKTHRDVE